MDPIEKRLGNEVTTMTASEHVAYLRMYMQGYHGIDMPVDDIVDRKTMESFQKRYGRETAGRILQWVCLNHKARKDGRFITTSVFSTRMKWWTDAMWLECQADQQRRTDTQVGAEEAESGFVDLRSLRR